MMEVFRDLVYELDFAGVSPLLAATANGQMGVVRCLVENCPDVLNGNPVPLFEEAVNAGDSAVFAYLIEKSGFDFSSGDAGLLQMTVDLAHGEMIDFLVSRGVSLAGVCLTRLAAPGVSDLLEHVLALGGDINATRPESQPPIIAAIIEGGLVGAERFLRLGATLSAELIESHPKCFVSAIKGTDHRLIELLLSNHPNLSNLRRILTLVVEEWLGPSSELCRHAPPECAWVLPILRLLIENGARDFHDPLPSPAPQGRTIRAGWTPVDTAIWWGSMDMLRLFHEFGFDWKTVTCTWTAHDPSSQKVHTFLSERGAIMLSESDPFHSRWPRWTTS
jgi:hypothetical protein